MSTVLPKLDLTGLIGFDKDDDSDALSKGNDNGGKERADEDDGFSMIVDGENNDSSSIDVKGDSEKGEDKGEDKVKKNARVASDGASYVSAESGASD